jgi:FKBP-type peptidyl-prolyl cis-trans isomerase 2
MKRVYIILAVACAGFIACQSSDQKAATPALTPEAKDLAKKDSANFTSIQWIDSTFKDLGKIAEGKVVEVAYRFKNSGTKPLVITNVYASCGCTVPEKPEKPYAPGEEGVIKAKFDSRGRPKGVQNKTVYVDANVDQAPQQLNFKVEIE